jgi:hypothetical protein
VCTGRWIAFGTFKSRFLRHPRNCWLVMPAPPAITCLNTTVVSDWCRYHGQFANNMKNGMGEQAYPNGDIYRGSFKDDNREGFGIIVYKESGDIYRGNVRAVALILVYPRAAWRLDGKGSLDRALSPHR